MSGARRFPSGLRRLSRGIQRGAPGPVMPPQVEVVANTGANPVVANTITVVAPGP